MIRLVPALLAPALFTLAACVAPGAGTPPASVDGSYRLLSIDGAQIPGSVSMTISGSSVRGDGPCNAWWTTNAADWPAMRLAPIAATRRACLIEGGEAAFMAALQQASRAVPAPQGLELIGPAHRMVFAVGE